MQVIDVKFVKYKIIKYKNKKYEFAVKFIETMLEIYLVSFSRIFKQFPVRLYVGVY